MDINDLNKSQLILLAILLSFITSIATGITTVTLMQQAPESVTVPINRVIKQTVEKIQQVEGKTTLQTVIVKEEDLIVDAIAKNQGAQFTLTKEVKSDGNDQAEVSAGKGFVVSDKNILVADSMFVQGEGNYFATNSSGKFKAQFLLGDKSGFAFLKIGAPVDEKNVLTTSVPPFADVNKMKVGQKVLVLGNNISSFMFDGDKNIKISATLGNAGAMIINLEGEVLGLSLYNEQSSFASIDAIKTALASVSAE
ncbi:hypothetical protein HZA26_03380 [Candidatus Nomurabacteria bacterium]|nr:hypothetical protein [Candidatus Nomurabacteria bacterium]